VTAKHKEATFPLLYRAISKYEDIPAIFFAVYNYRAVAELIYFGYDLHPFP